MAAMSALGILGLGCDDYGKDLPPPPTDRRSDAVLAKETATASGKAAPGKAPAAPKKLCEGKGSQRPAPTSAVKTAMAEGAQALPASLPFGVGKWTWVNLWAAWCGPCKEEMPRLLAWQKKLSAAGVSIDLAFVSLDDDQRQMQRFLDAQPPAGVRATYWLPEGEGRGAWVGAFGLKDPPQLPVQILVAPSGQVACVIEGAVDEPDYASLASFVGAKR